MCREPPVDAAESPVDDETLSECGRADPYGKEEHFDCYENGSCLLRCEWCKFLPTLVNNPSLEDELFLYTHVHPWGCVRLCYKCAHKNAEPHCKGTEDEDDCFVCSN